MPQSRCSHLVVSVSLAVFLLSSVPLCAQFGGGGGGGGPQMPGGEEKPNFSEHIHSTDALMVRREKGGKMVASVRVTGNQTVSKYKISQALQTRKDRFYDYETVLGDVRRLRNMGAFDDVTIDVTESPAGMVVSFIVAERPTISEVVFHGNMQLNNRELSGRAGLASADPLSEFSIESARRRLLDYYHDEGFNSVSVASSIGYEGKPNAVVFRINEGPLERINSITIEGSTVVSEARLKKVIKSRGPMVGVIAYLGNQFDIRKVNADVDVLATYYHNLGYLTATVGRRIEYDNSGKWVDVTFVVDEGERYSINDVIIVGNQFITEASLRQRLTLGAGDMFNGSVMRTDIGEIVYGYGEEGYIYAEVEPKTVMREEANTVDLVYEINEGDRWKIGRISVNIDGEPHLMRETTMLNMLDMREGDWIDRRMLEVGRRRIIQSQLLETNPSISEPADIKVVPREELY